MYTNLRLAKTRLNPKWKVHSSHSQDEIERPLQYNYKM